ncbi:MAG TPA: hypothetical protein VK008_05445 [Sphingobacteriaceae bacterium]|nr:hypothetical protein [Sphingobacteriaceae bacterium]
MSSPSREEMEQALAGQFGFPDYAILCRELERTMGKGVVRQLERKLAKYPSGRNAPGGFPDPNVKPQ